MLSFTSKNIFTFMLLTFVLVLRVGMEDLSAQTCPDNKARNYANFQGNNVTGLTALGLIVSPGVITNPTFSVDGIVSTATTLSVPLGTLGVNTATQYLEFTSSGTHASRRTISAGTPVTVKLSLPQEILGLLSGISIGTFTNLTAVTENKPFAGSYRSEGYIGVGETEFYTGANLLALLNGAGEVEITFTPTANYSGIYVRLSSLLSLNLSASVYHAYIMEDAVGDANCSTTIDVISGVMPTGALAVANVTGSVTNPGNSIDTDPTNSTFTLMNAGAQVLSKVYETILFNKPSIAGDSIKIVLQNPAGTLLDLTVLSGFTIQPYLNNVAAGPAFLSNTSSLSLRLLPASGNKYELVFPVSASYDRVEISMMGAANLLSNLRIYDVKRIIAKPIIQAAGLTAQNITICVGETPTLSLSNVQTSTCITYTWYKDNVVQSPTGPTYQLPSSLPAGTHSYKVVATRTGCTESSESIPVTVTVNELPTATISGSTSVCQHTTLPSVTFTGANGTAPYTFTYNIDGGPTLTTTSTSGNSAVVNAQTATSGTYVYNLLSVQGSSPNLCINSLNASATIVIKSAPPTPIINITN